jgi:hypothetical protein
MYYSMWPCLSPTKYCTYFALMVFFSIYTYISPRTNFCRLASPILRMTEVVVQSFGWHPTHACIYYYRLATTLHHSLTYIYSMIIVFYMSSFQLTLKVVMKASVFDRANHWGDHACMSLFGAFCFKIGLNEYY